MLFRQDLSRRHHSGLIAVFRHEIARDDLNDRLDLDLTSEEYDSVGGFIIEHLDRLPEIGDGVTTEDDIHLVVEKLDKNRIESVHLYLPEPKPENEEGDED